VVTEGRIVYRDAYYDQYKLAIELDGKLAHPTGSAGGTTRPAPRGS
jgi:hypothetical protein